MLKYFLYISLIISLLSSTEAWSQKKSSKDQLKGEIKTFEWDFAGETFHLSINLDREIYYHYIHDKRPKISADPDAFFQKFLERKSGDQVIKQIAKALVEITKELELDPHEVVPLSASFVQSLPDELAHINLSGDLVRVKFPYVTLWDGSGTCCDKSMLGIALLKELGYGASLLYFHSVPIPSGGLDKHVAFGVASLSLAYFKGYSYISPNDPDAGIGCLPALDADTFWRTDPDAEDEEKNLENLKNLGPVITYLNIPGKKYP